jgi:hypothetical protein
MTGTPDRLSHTIWRGFAGATCFGLLPPIAFSGDEAAMRKPAMIVMLSPGASEDRYYG